MITTNLRPASRPHRQEKLVIRKKGFHNLAWLCLLLACIGSSWFAFQVFLIPQPATFTPEWQTARWIQAAETTAPVAYFRHTMVFDIPPDSAYVTITASQVFRLYVNGIYIGSNTMDFVQGNTPQTYMFDIDATLLKGINVLGLRVANVDEGVPQVRANIGAMWGQETIHYSSNTYWQATGDTALAHPRAIKSQYAWSMPTFDASGWRSAQLVTQEPASAPLLINPRIYQQPMPTHWISAGSRQESYYVRQFSVAHGFDNALLRLVATGEADIFINDHLYTQWNGLVNVPQTSVVNTLTTNGEAAPYRNGLMLGIYDISPYIHTGTNIIAVHILAPGTTTAKVGLDTLRSAMSMDMLMSSGSSYSNPLASDIDWHTSSQSVPGWTHESAETAGWQPPSPVGRPGSSHSFYLPDSNTNRNAQVIPPALIAEVLASSCLAVLSGWLLFALVVLHRYYPSKRRALEAATLIWLPTLACELLLLALSRATQLPQPFPFTWQWGSLLIAITLLSALALWQHARRIALSPHNYVEEQTVKRETNWLYAQFTSAIQSSKHTKRQQLCYWLQHNWAILPVILIAIFMVCYHPSYEPYWQDELSSYYAARFIMTHGYPAFPSGFFYAKGEFFSLLLAIVMTFFGTTSHLVPRLISMSSFLVSLPILYTVGSRLFNRRVGWLATTMLAFSPYAMIWSRQTRMYELAQFMVIIVLFLFYRAIQNHEKVRPIFLAFIALVIAYFCHEEVFIILPAVAICSLVGTRQGPYGIPAVMRKKHWWLAALMAATIIIIQLSTVFLTHPPKFGTDQSQRPQIQVTTDNIPYYYHLLVAPLPPKDGPTPWVASTPFIMVDTLLAVLGCVIAFCRKDKRARYCALFLISASSTLIFIFTMEADRYYYPLLPVLYLMGAYALWQILHALWTFARPYLSMPPRWASSTNKHALSTTVQTMVMATAGLVCLSIVLTPMLPLSNFNLFLSRITGTSYHKHYADYDHSSQYIKDHMQNGDIVISASPAVITLYYVGHVDHFFSIDRALFLFERDGKLLETTSGSHPLLNQADFQVALASHNRIWLISDNGGYQGGVTKDGRFTFPPPDFRMVYEGYGSSVYFRSGSN